MSESVQPPTGQPADDKDEAGVASGSCVPQQQQPSKPLASRAQASFGPSLPARPGGPNRALSASGQARSRDQKRASQANLPAPSARLHSLFAHKQEHSNAADVRYQISLPAKQSSAGTKQESSSPSHGSGHRLPFKVPMGLGGSSHLMRPSASSSLGNPRLPGRQGQSADSSQLHSRPPSDSVAHQPSLENPPRGGAASAPEPEAELAEWPLRSASVQGADRLKEDETVLEDRLRPLGASQAATMETGDARRPPENGAVGRAEPDANDLRTDAEASVAGAWPQRDVISDNSLREATLRGEHLGPPSKVTRLPVVCNGNRGVFMVDRQVIVCLCSQCEARARKDGRLEMELSPTDFERHSGSCTSKKWKYTVKVLEEMGSGFSPGISVGSWLEKNVPTLAKGRGKLLGYSSIFGDVAPVQTHVVLPPGRRTLAKAKVRKRASSHDEWQEPSVERQRDDPPRSPSPDGGVQSSGGGEAAVVKIKAETPDAPLGGVTAAELTSPSGKKWLAAADDSQAEVPLPAPAMREGARFQADIPDYRGPRAQAREEDDPRAGLAGPSTLEALALAASYEKQASEGLHIDAVADPEYHPGAVHDVRNLIVDRGQRTRRKPRWLNNTVDPEASTRIRHTTAEELVEEGPLLSWRPKSVPKRRLSLEDAEDRDERKKMRPLNWLPSRNDDHRGGHALQDGSPPRIMQYQLLNDGFMRITISHHGQVFTGALMAQPGGPKPVQHYERNGRLGSDENSDSESQGWGASRAPADSKPSWTQPPSAGLTATSDGPEVESYGAAPKTNPASQPKTNQNRRTLANRDYERLQAEGPPEDARCALCRQRADPQAKGCNRTEEGGPDVDFEVLERKDEGLGPFLLVRVSAIMNAWVHLQCALWSPEVYVNTHGGVERASEAIRRGRMIKCKLCGEKGATLGCHKRSCRASFHLHCAREHTCLLQGSGDEPYLVTCREHSEISNEMDLVPQMPLMPDQVVRGSPDMAPARPRNVRRDSSEFGGQRSPRRFHHGSRGSGWSQLPKMSASLDTLSAAALASRSANIESAVNPLAAQHFGGTVGQSVLRPGRCAVCVIQRKGVCGTQTAPKKCLRRIALSAAGRDIPDAPPGWRTRRPVAHWPAAPHDARHRSESPGDCTPRGSESGFLREGSVPRSTTSRD